jgi:hypothetical protein
MLSSVLNDKRAVQVNIEITIRGLMEEPEPKSRGIGFTAP